MTAWHTLPVREIQKHLETGDGGLSPEEAARRLERYGPNEVEAEREDPWWKVLLHQFQDPLIYILIAAAFVTLILGHVTDSAVIAVVVLINATIGFLQEFRARAAMRALSRLSAPQSEVVREGKPRTIPSRELVPGDVILLTSGVRVPSDARLASVRDLEVDESALTGESVAVRKKPEPLQEENLVAGDQVNLVFAGTTVVRGRGRAIVIRTGEDTELGRIAVSMRQLGQTRTPLQENLDRFGKKIGMAILLQTAVVAAIGFMRAMPPAEMFVTAVALAVASIPEGLPVVLTITLAIGVRRMARRNAIIRALPAVETLGSTSVIGSDKTGTLTRNEMTVRAIWSAGRRYSVTGVGYDFDGEIEREGGRVTAEEDAPLRATLLAASLANEADAAALEDGRVSGDPTEIALYVAAAKAGLRPGETRHRYRELDILPFEPEQRFMATLNEGPDGRAVYMKGAPEVVLGRCSARIGDSAEEDMNADEIREPASELAGEGLRVLAMAVRPTDRDRLSNELLQNGFRLAGLVGIEDPVRPEAVQAVAAARNAGIRVIMLTGDHVNTASAIGRQLGLGNGDTRAVEGSELEALADEELDRMLDDVRVYARVAPEHKLRIVQRLKARGEVVAVTGDGVNDAPALRAAHVGVAMGKSGTDVAREASDIVLADDNFATITAAVEEGRVVFANIRKVTFFLLSTAVGQALAIIVALLVGWPIPFVAAQILWINLVTSGLQDVALAFEPGEPGLLQRPPRSIDEGVLTLRLFERLILVGLVLSAGTLAMFWVTLERTGDVEMARTVAMTQMVVFQFFHVFNCRSLDRSIFRLSPFSNPFLFASLMAALAAQIAVLHVPFLQRVFRTVPLDLDQWLTIVAAGSLVVVGGELDKLVNRWRHRPLG